MHCTKACKVKWSWLGRHKNSQIRPKYFKANVESDYNIEKLPYQGNFERLKQQYTSGSLQSVRKRWWKFLQIRQIYCAKRDLSVHNDSKPVVGLEPSAEED